MVEAKKYRVVEEISAHGKREFFPERKVLGMWWRYGAYPAGDMTFTSFDAAESWQQDRHDVVIATKIHHVGMDGDE
jgi:hypothetical protein